VAPRSKQFGGIGRGPQRQKRLAQHLQQAAQVISDSTDFSWSRCAIPASQEPPQLWMCHRGPSGTMHHLASMIVTRGNRASNRNRISGYVSAYVFWNPRTCRIPLSSFLSITTPFMTRSVHHEKFRVDQLRSGETIWESRAILPDQHRPRSSTPSHHPIPQGAGKVYQALAPPCWQRTTNYPGVALCIP